MENKYKFDYKILYPNGIKTYYLTIKIKPVTIYKYNNICSVLYKNRNYSIPLEQDNVKLAKDNNLTLKQVLSLRNIILKDKIIKRYNLMNKYIKKIALLYNNNSDILSLSLKYDFPPLNLLRGILLFNGSNPTELYNIFALKQPATKYLCRRDLEQYNIANKNDAEAMFNQAEVAKRALQNENNFINLFYSIGIGLKTQYNLLAEQQNENVILTPDILFTDIVYINNKRIYWIDYKDYIGTPVNFLYTSNKKQALKYYKKWGYGALCYSCGFINNLTIEGAMLLDESTIL